MCSFFCNLCKLFLVLRRPFRCINISSSGFDTEAEMVDYMVNSFNNQCDNPLLGNLFTIHSILIFSSQPESYFPMKLPIQRILLRRSSPTKYGMILITNVKITRTVPFLFYSLLLKMWFITDFLTRSVTSITGRHTLLGIQLSA